MTLHSRTTYTLKCDKCPALLTDSNAYMLLKRAKAKGWTTTETQQGNRHHCERCSNTPKEG